MLLKEKRNRNFKGWARVDGQKQKQVYQKNYATYTTVSLELVFITSVINKHKMRGVAVVDIPGKLLTTDMEKDFIVVLQVILVELRLNTKPSIYREFVKIKNVQKFIYVNFSEVTLRVPAECAIVLREADGVSEVKRVSHQPTWSMCIQYNGKWKVYEHIMAHQQLKNIACWRRWSDKNNRLDEGNLRQSHEVIPWEKTRLPWDVPWLISGWIGQGDNDRLPKEYCVWIFWDNARKNGNTSSRNNIHRKGRRQYETVGRISGHCIPLLSCATIICHSTNDERYTDSCVIIHYKGEETLEVWLAGTITSATIHQINYSYAINIKSG